MASEGERGQGQDRGERDKKREDERRRDTWPSAWLPATHSWSWCCASESPSRAACVNKRIESVLVTWSSVLSSRFSSTVPFYFTSLQLIPLPYYFLFLSAVLERFPDSLQVFLLLLEILHGRRFTQFLFSNFVPFGFSTSRYEFSNQFARCNACNMHNPRDLFLVPIDVCAIFLDP